MIKRLYFLLFLFLCTIVATAQIQRKILDFTLGVSNKTEVLSYLKSNHYKYSYEDGEYEVRKVTFAGHNWPVAYFSFYKGKLYGNYVQFDLNA